MVKMLGFREEAGAIGRLRVEYKGPVCHKRSLDIVIQMSDMVRLAKLVF